MKLVGKLILSTVSIFLTCPVTQQAHWARISKNDEKQRNYDVSSSNYNGHRTWSTFGTTYNSTWWQKSQKPARSSSSREPSAQNAYHSFQNQANDNVAKKGEFEKENTYPFAPKPPEQPASKDNFAADWSNLGEYQTKCEQILEQNRTTTKRRDCVDSKEKSTQPDFTSEQEEIINKILGGNNTDFFYLELFGMEESASSQDIWKAYRKKSLLVHPDRNKHPRANEAFTELQIIATRLKQKAEEKEELQRKIKEYYEKGPMDFTTSQRNHEFGTNIYGGNNAYFDAFQRHAHPEEETRDRAQPMPQQCAQRRQYTSVPKQPQQPPKDDNPTRKSKWTSKSTYEEPRIQTIRRKGQPNRQKKQTFNHLPKKDQIKYQQKFQSRRDEDNQNDPRAEKIKERSNSPRRSQSTTESGNQRESATRFEDDDRNNQNSEKQSRSTDDKPATESSHQNKCTRRLKNERRNKGKPGKHSPSAYCEPVSESSRQQQSTSHFKTEHLSKEKSEKTSRSTDGNPMTESSRRYQPTPPLKNDDNERRPEKDSQSTDRKGEAESSHQYQSVKQSKNQRINNEKLEKWTNEKSQLENDSESSEADQLSKLKSKLRLQSENPPQTYSQRHIVRKQSPPSDKSNNRQQSPPQPRVWVYVPKQPSQPPNQIPTTQLRTLRENNI